jgi:hypothetical protein
MATQVCQRDACTIYVFEPSADTALIRRIRGEYREMPGLRLSPEQASRLWSVDIGTCSRLLGALVDSGFLRRDFNGRYARSHSGY